MWNLVTLYVLFGVANWAAHILRCKACRHAALGVMIMGLEGLVFTLAWPMYVHAIFISSPEEPKDESFAAVADRLKKEDKFFMLEFKKNPDETDEQFQNRMISEAAYHMKERFRKEKGGA